MIDLLIGVFFGIAVTSAYTGSRRLVAATWIIDASFGLGLLFLIYLFVIAVFGVPTNCTITGACN